MTHIRLPFILSAALASALAFTANAAIPGQPMEADVKTIDACLADAVNAKTDQDVCIGRISSQCQENAPTTAAKEACNDRELLVWNAALVRDYARLTALVTDNNVKQALRDAERDFVVAKLAKCTFDRLVHKDSPDGLIAASRCDVTATARQDLWLNQEIESLSSH